MVSTNGSIWKKILYLSLILFGLTVLDNTVVHFFAIKKVYPSILFVFIICYSIINGYEEGIILGIVAGFFQDIYFPGVTGINMLCNMLLCVVAAKIGESIFKEKVIIPAISVFVLSALKSFMVYGMFILIGKPESFLNIIFYKALYEMVVTIFIYKLVLKFSETKTMKKEWRF